jgi:hypothetical protein
MIDLALFCRNEAPRVAGALRALRRECERLGPDRRPLRVAVMENGSTDDTAAAAERAGAALTEHGVFEVEVRAGLPAGKTAAWNAFVAHARSDILVFMVREVETQPAVDLISAVPSVSPDFRPSGFWQSVFAVPYHGLRPAPSVTGNLYAGRRRRLAPLDPDVLHEDLALALRHEGAFRVSATARVWVTPPRRLTEFLRQRVRCLRADLAETVRFEKDVAPHRRRSARDLADYLRAGGPVRLVAFLFARFLATAIARWRGPWYGGGWSPDAGR